MTFTSFLITLGIVVSFLYTLKVYHNRTGEIIGVLALYPISFILAVIFSRFLHWYSSSTTYDSILQCLTDFSKGSFCGSGIVIGIVLASVIVDKLNVCRDKGMLMDCAAPSFALLMVFVRLSAWGTGKCQGGKNITSSIFQRFPFAIKVTDAAGNTYYRFATFMVAAILYALVFILIRKLYKKKCKKKMIPPCPRYGNIWNMMLLAYSCIEIVLDSTRIDSMHFTFRKILTLNRFSTFVSIGQVVPFIILITLLVHYVKCSSKAEGFNIKHIISIVAFLVAAFLIGFLGEYKWQRVGSYTSYIFMTIGSLIIAVVIYMLYKGCIKKKY